MNQDAPRNEPQEFNIVLESPQLSAEQWARFLAMQRLKQSMRQGPKPQRTLTISFGDQPDFYIVEELGKG